MFRHILCGLLLSLSSLSANALTEAQAALMCQRVFGGAGWHAIQDDEIKTIAGEFISRIGKSSTPIVCGGQDSIPYLAGAQFIHRGLASYFVVAVDPSLRLAIGSEIRGIVAHEVAHHVTDSGVQCSSLLTGTNRDAYLGCEHRADREGDRLAGRGQVARSLLFVVEHLIRTRGAGDEHAVIIIRDFHRRIFLLR